MSDIVQFGSVKDYILTIRDQKVILDRDVAKLYGVQTKRVNEAVKNNPDKFPDGYIFEMNEVEFENFRSKFSTENESLKSNKLALNTDEPEMELRSKLSTLKKNDRGKHSKYLPKAFTEKGLYMLATILKSTKATQTTIAIVEAFAQLRELSRTIASLTETRDEEVQKNLLQKSSNILTGILDDGMHVSDTETTMEVNFAVFKVKHTIKRKK